MLVVFVWLINTLAGLNITFPKPVRVRLEKEKDHSLPSAEQ
jgi:hypothetical protein